MILVKLKIDSCPATVVSIPVSRTPNKMHRVTILLVLAAFKTVGQVIVPSSVPITTRENWCTKQKASCPLLCLQIPGSTGAEQNDCKAVCTEWSNVDGW